MRVLLVEDNTVDALAVQAALRASTDPAVDVVHHASLTPARNALADGAFDCVLLDLDLPDSEGIDTLHTVLGDERGLPVVVLTGPDSPERGLEAVAAGAQDYLNKDEVSPSMLLRALRYAVARHAAAEELRLRTVELADTNRRLQRAEAQLRDRADHDALTGVLTRWAFEEQASAELTRLAGRRAGFGMFFCDLDGFKGVNDDHGHPIGDQVLVSCARRIASSVRASDLVGRIGGDEFVVFSPDLENVDQLTTIARRLVSDVSAPVTAAGHQLTVGISIGIVAVDDAALAQQEDGLDLASLIGRADQAMYRAKAAGGNRWHMVRLGSSELSEVAGPSPVPERIGTIYLG